MNPLINNIEAVALNKEEYKEKLRHVDLRYYTSKDYQERPSLYLSLITSNKSGSGTAGIRKVVEKSLKKGCEGRYHCDASWSSHIFHLYMGMIPEDTSKFIPLVLGILQRANGSFRPSTKRLGSVPMVLSDDGLKVWKEAIEKNQEFVPFRNFEHLQKNMNEEQQSTLIELLSLRGKDTEKYISENEPC